MKARRGAAKLAWIIFFAAAPFATSQDTFLQDYSKTSGAFPGIHKPYESRRIPGPDLTNSSEVPLPIDDNRLKLSMRQLLAAVVNNNLGIASARYYPSIAQTDLLRARSGASPRGVDVTQIPSEVFAGAQGGSILAGAAGGGFGGAGASNAGGITGGASQVLLRPNGVFDPSLSLNFSVDHTASPLNSLIVAGVPSVTTGTAAFSANYVQAFSSGTSFNISYSMQRKGSTQLNLLDNPAFTPGFTFTVTQQLMNGFGFKANRALIKVAENEQGIERESFRTQVVSAVSAAQNAYWDLVSAQENVRVAQEAVQVALQLEAINKRQEEVGTMSKLDVATAQSQVASSQRDLIAAGTNLQNASLQLKSMFSKTLDDNFAAATIETSDGFPDVDAAKLPTLEEAVAAANQNRPEVAVAQGNIKSQEDVAPFVHNALKPSLNVYGLVSNVGLYDVFGTSFVQAVQFKYPQAAVGVSLTFPVHNRQAQADYARSRLELRQSQDTLVRTKRQVEIDVQNALIALTQARAQVAAARGAVRSNRTKLDAEQTKLRIGASTAYNVVLIQRDLFNSEYAEVQANAVYAKARVALDQAMGVTLERNRIPIEDALAGRLKP